MTAFADRLMSMTAAEIPRAALDPDHMAALLSGLASALGATVIAAAHNDGRQIDEDSLKAELVGIISRSRL